MNDFKILTFHSDNKQVDNAFRIAVGDILGNIQPFRDGLLENDESCIMAGLDYDTPWTRDAAINTWNGAGLMVPEVTRSTLLSVLTRKDRDIIIGGQYWDCIIWAIGAWYQYLFTGDKAFLNVAYLATKNTLTLFEEEEFNSKYGLFRGCAVYGDGVAAYPDIYANAGGSASILDWVVCNNGLKAEKGFGIPMHALSTNCVYYYVYQLVYEMEKELGYNPQEQWLVKAVHLKASINLHFWNPSERKYKYLVDSFGGCNRQEGMGNSFAILFGLANEKQKEDVFSGIQTTLNGIPCVYPTYERYQSFGQYEYGRHSGTVWPHIQGFWAQACIQEKNYAAFQKEFYALLRNADRDCQFAEIYHPVSGLMYGGIQEGLNGRTGLWKSCVRQTWSATAFIRMVLMGLLGMSFHVEGLKINPISVGGICEMQVQNIKYRNMLLNIHVCGGGTEIEKMEVNGAELFESHTIPSHLSGEVQVKVWLKAAQI